MSELTLIIGNKNYSSWSLRPWLLMRHHQLDFDEKRIPLSTVTTDDELSEYHSDFKVPVLKDRDLLIWDSLSILEYLSEQYLDNRGWPSNPRARSVARSVSAEMHSSFQHVRNELPMNCRKQFDGIEVSDDANREIQRICWLWNHCRTEFGVAGDWLFGEFTIADAMYAPVALRFHGYNIPLPAIQQRYVNSVLLHPGVVEWMKAGRRETEIIALDEIEPQLGPQE